MAAIKAAELFAPPTPPTSSSRISRNSDGVDRFDAVFKSTRSTRQERLDRTDKRKDATPGDDAEKASDTKDTRKSDSVDAKDDTAVNNDAAAAQVAANTTVLTDQIVVPVVTDDADANVAVAVGDDVAAVDVNDKTSSDRLAQTQAFAELDTDANIPNAEAVTDTADDAVAEHPATVLRQTPPLKLPEEIATTETGGEVEVAVDDGLPQVDVDAEQADDVDDHVVVDHDKKAKTDNSLNETRVKAEPIAKAADDTVESDKTAPVSHAVSERHAADRTADRATREPAESVQSETRAAQVSSTENGDSNAADSRQQRGDASGQREGLAERIAALGGAVTQAAVSDTTLGESTATVTADVAGTVRSKSTATPADSVTAAVTTDGAARSGAAKAAGSDAIGANPLIHDDPTPVPLDRFANVLRSHINGERWNVRMQLDPPELGKVQLNVKMQDGGLAVQMHVANDDVRKLLESRVSELVDSLREQDVRVSQTQISVRHAESGSNDNASEHRDNQFRHSTDQNNPQSEGRDSSHRDGARGDSRWREPDPIQTRSDARTIFNTQAALDLVA